MFKLDFDPSLIQKMITDAVETALSKHTFVHSLPPVLTKAQLQEVLDIGATKASELLNREDFPVIREFGHPRVPSHLLMQWIDDHTEWVQKNSGPRWKEHRNVS